MKKTNVSEFQKKEINHATFKRNKMFIDIDKIETQQKLYSIKRRHPYILNKSPKSERIDKNIEGSFTNSVTQLLGKLEDETKKFKSRVALSPSNTQKLDSETETGSKTFRTLINQPELNECLSRQPSTIRKTGWNIEFHQNQQTKQSKIKGIPLDKQISREYLHRYSVQRNYAVDERNFNNFYITKHDLTKTQDFNKLSPRGNHFVQDHINDLTYNTENAYQKFYFSSKPMKATFRLSLQNNKDGRKFFIPKKPQDLPKTVLDPQKIQKSFTEATNFKSNKIYAFYKMVGRQLPHQLQQRQLSPNSNYYKDKEGKLIKGEVDFSSKKLYDDLVRKQKSQLYRKKNPEFTRDEICDLRYFKEKIKRQNKLLMQN